MYLLEKIIFLKINKNVLDSKSRLTGKKFVPINSPAKVTKNPKRSHYIPNPTHANLLIVDPSVSERVQIWVQENPVRISPLSPFPPSSNARAPPVGALHGLCTAAAAA